jgi:hypothetical protein
MYDEKPLEKDQIRLLSISTEKTGDAQVQCSFETAVFDNHQPPPKYTALSYTWGHHTSARNIELNKNTFPATKNLKDALQHFRNTQNPIPKLWVDAICINQKHTDERIQQVGLMRKIFSEAEETWVWLGPEENESSKAVDLINDLSHVYRNSLKKGGTEPEHADQKRWGSLKSRGLEDNLLALDYLLAREYWYRVWIVQEIAVSSNLILFCGQRKFFWNSLVSTAYLLNSQVETRRIIREKRNGEESYKGVLGGIQRILSIQSVRNDFQKPSESRPPDSLLSLLSNHRSTGASVKADKYIALAGLAGLDHSKDNLYRREVEDVYTIGCESITKEKQHKPLDFLDCAGQQRSFLMPTWVPDWSLDQGQPAPLLYWDLASKKDQKLVPFGAPGSTSSRNKTTFLIQWEEPKNPEEPGKPGKPGKALLRAPGFTVNTINSVQGPLTKYSGHQTLVNSTQHERPDYPTHEQLAKRLWKTLVLDRAHVDGREAPESWEHIFYDHVTHPPSDASQFSVVQQWYDKNKHFKICGSTLEELAHQPRSPISEQILNLDEELAHFKTAFINAVGYRKLASTESGHLCLLPFYAKAGDIVVVLADCSVPVLLRRRENEEVNYEFIGTCYVHGIMHGEAVDRLAVDPFSEWFDIR